MTIDEAIEHCEEVAEDMTNVNESKLDLIYCGDTECITEHMARCAKCADEHKQLADWLKDYKRLKGQQVNEECVKRILESLREMEDAFDVICELNVDAVLSKMESEV